MKVDNRINFDGQTLFKVGVGESYTVFTSVAAPSPINRSSGVSPTNAFDAVRPSVGGALYAGYSDAAGPASPDDIHFVIQPGDVIAVGAIASGKAPVTINGQLVANIAATAVAGVLGFYA